MKVKVSYAFSIITLAISVSSFGLDKRLGIEQSITSSRVLCRFISSSVGIAKWEALCTSIVVAEGRLRRRRGWEWRLSIVCRSLVALHKRIVGGTTTHKRIGTITWTSVLCLCAKWATRRSLSKWRWLGLRSSLITIVPKWTREVRWLLELVYRLWLWLWLHLDEWRGARLIVHSTHWLLEWIWLHWCSTCIWVEWTRLWSEWIWCRLSIVAEGRLAWHLIRLALRVVTVKSHRLRRLWVQVWALSAQWILSNTCCIEREWWHGRCRLLFWIHCWLEVWFSATVLCFVSRRICVLHSVYKRWLCCTCIKNSRRTWGWLLQERIARSACTRFYEWVWSSDCWSFSCHRLFRLLWLFLFLACRPKCNWNQLYRLCAWLSLNIFTESLFLLLGRCSTLSLSWESLFWCRLRFSFRYCLWWIALALFNRVIATIWYRKVSLRLCWLMIIFFSNEVFNSLQWNFLLSTNDWLLLRRWSFLSNWVKLKIRHLCSPNSGLALVRWQALDWALRLPVLRLWRLPGRMILRGHYNLRRSKIASLT